MNALQANQNKTSLDFFNSALKARKMAAKMHGTPFAQVWIQNAKNDLATARRLRIERLQTIVCNNWEAGKLTDSEAEAQYYALEARK